MRCRNRGNYVGALQQVDLVEHVIAQRILRRESRTVVDLQRNGVFASRLDQELNLGRIARRDDHERGYKREDESPERDARLALIGVVDADQILQRMDAPHGRYLV